MAGFLFRLELEGGTPADPPTFETATPTWNPGDTIPLVERAVAEEDGALLAEHLPFEERQFFVEDGRAVLIACLGEVAARVLGRAVERNKGVEDDVRHVESFRSGDGFHWSDRLRCPDSSPLAESPVRIVSPKVVSPEGALDFGREVARKCRSGETKSGWASVRECHPSVSQAQPASIASR